MVASQRKFCKSNAKMFIFVLNWKIHYLRLGHELPRIIAKPHSDQMQKYFDAASLFVKISQKWQRGKNQEI